MGTIKLLVQVGAGVVSISFKGSSGVQRLDVSHYEQTIVFDRTAYQQLQTSIIGY